ncbi:MAG: DUF1080 domain-containing protein [Planctomycetes bacterium]|nr:DUF1080 domain-containing protein [Planctomycetota bacterium]
MRDILAAAIAVLGVSVPCLAQDIAPGWRGDPKVWRQDATALVGSTRDVELQQNTFLVSAKEHGDFVLCATVTMSGDNNSGVQYRSRALDGDGFRVGGFQCDWHAKPEYTGMLYDERGAGIAAQRGQMIRWTDAGIEVLGQLARADALDLTVPHQLRIVARGPLSWHEIDGRVVTAIEDLRSDAVRRGVIALQCHAGAPMDVRFDGLTIEDLADTAAADRAAPVPGAVRALLLRAAQRAALPQGAVPNWLWDADAQDGEELFFRRQFRVVAAARDARLSVSCDNHCHVFVNGEKVAQDDSWESPTVVDVSKRLVVGDNVVAVYGWNDGGVAAMALRLAWREGDADKELVSDAAWRCSEDDPDGWNAPGFDDSGWAGVKVLAALGQQGAPWSGSLGADGLGVQRDPYAPQVAVVDPGIQLHALPNVLPLRGDVVQLLDVPRSLGSWVSLGADPKGRLYAGNQGGGLYRIVPAREAGELSTIERVPVELGGAHGLLWFRDSLYAVVNGRDSGLYRLTDTDGDDQLDRVELLRKLEGDGEHGPHSVVVAPDGENLLVLCGNHTKVPELFASRMPAGQAEDRPVPRLEDPHQYWEGHSPPGGWVCQVDPDGKRWELLCCGFRNPYDLVVLSNGRVVVYDADMEWDMGMPWYRPTRLLQVQSGVDYGWRIGSAKWPDDYPDAPPALCDVGPGSPVGMAVLGNDWMADSFLLLDWTFGTAYAATLPRGERRAQLAQFASGVPWPVADVAVAAGGIYVVAGGRGLPSTLTRLLQQAAPAGDPPYGMSPPRVVWDRFAAYGAASVESLLSDRADEDCWAARVALEHRPVAEWRERALAVDVAAPQRAWVGLLALARQGVAEDLGPLLDALGKFSFAKLEHLDRIAWLRVHALGLMRLGTADAVTRAAVGARLLPLFPTGDEREDQDLCELLALVDAKGLLDKAVPLLTPLKPSAPPAWAEVITRNKTYGGVIAKMIDNMPPLGQLAIANALRTVANGWTLDQRRALFTFFGEARQRSGGSSYDGFVQRMIDAAWATCTPAEQQALAEVVGKARAELPKFQSTPPKGPGHDWQVSDIAELSKGDLAGRDVAAGRNLFHAVGCASCHYFAGEGGFGGPDLTSLGNKFSAADVLESVLEPSKVISDQYSGQVLTKQDGSALFGVVRKIFDGDTEVYEVVPAVAEAKPVRVAVADVQKVEPSPLSPMPTDLIDRLSADEVKDLLAFLLSRGQR